MDSVVKAPQTQSKLTGPILLISGMGQAKTYSQRAASQVKPWKKEMRIPSTREFQVKRRISLSRHRPSIHQEICHLNLKSKLYPSPACLGNYYSFIGYWRTKRPFTFADELPFRLVAESTEKSFLHGRGNSQGSLTRSWSRPLPLVATGMVNRERAKKEINKQDSGGLCNGVDGAIPLFFPPPSMAKSDQNRRQRA